MASRRLVVADIKREGIPPFWIDPLEMQNAYTLEAKGWTKKVYWKPSTVPAAGLGVFAAERIPKGAIYRILRDGQTMIVLNTLKDFPNLTDMTKRFVANYCAKVDDVCFIMTPGSSVNHHHKEHNTRVIKVSDVEIHGVATRDIEINEELFCDYVEFGTPPEWLVSFAKEHGIQLPFKECNDFV